MVKKCKGVPLAIRSLGSLMHLKTKESEWSSILESELWRSFQENEDVLSVLKLSYYHLPTYLRQCFTYCAMFPKYYEFNKETLIRLWIAQGYIVCSSKDGDLEDVGDQYFKELLSRSFFHLSEKMSHYKVHDLIHDLAQSIAKDRYFSVERICERIHHVYWPFSFNEMERLVEVKGIRTLFFEGVLEHVESEKDLNMIFSNFEKLRALHLGYVHCRVPNSIAKLKYLRYLQICGYYMEALPKSITNLQNLQTLILSKCSNLRELPRNIKKLISLRCLMIDGCFNLRCMPIGLGKLTCLRHLSDFVVAWDEGSLGAMLNELNGLNQLRGKIVLRNLKNVENVELESKQLILREKKCLQSLELRWIRNYTWYVAEDPTDIVEVEKSELLLQKLEPHPNLQHLTVKTFMGVRFSSWLSSITSLVEIKLHYCTNLKQLPPLDQLPSLKILCLRRLDSLEYILDEEPSFLQSPSIAFFPSLQEIELENCTNLRGWWRRRSGIELPQFPCLSKLKIKNCKDFTSMLLLPSLHQELHLEYARARLLHETMANASFSSIPAPLSKLKHLYVEAIPDLESLPQLQSLTSLQKLEIWDCPMLASISQGIGRLNCVQHLIITKCKDLILDDSDAMEWGGLRSLQSLYINDLPKLTSLPKGLQFVTNLQELTINGCSSLMALSDWIGNLTKLQRLKISDCPSLTSLPEGMHLLTSLQQLRIYGCLKLSARCMKEKGVDWPKIAHIPNLNIEDPGF
ncbi:hypothetical protein GH714_034456 [Hevea brasiliensis]|uniref:Uncharacterized protein n=1 Tax=Hevea brasiliensis TaxID=3981 RepID=A0A6A6N987_HEVBR|nr:hypothetical protein GH714_034456 [Hevea brasiliensis]